MVEIGRRFLVRSISGWWSELFDRGDKEAAGYARRIADDIVGLWSNHLHHQPYDVTGRRSDRSAQRWLSC